MKFNELLDHWSTIERSQWHCLANFIYPNNIVANIRSIWPQHATSRPPGILRILFSVWFAIWFSTRIAQWAFLTLIWSSLDSLTVAVWFAYDSQMILKWFVNWSSSCCWTCCRILLIYWSIAIELADDHIQLHSIGRPSTWKRFSIEQRSHLDWFGKQCKHC